MKSKIIGLLTLFILGSCASKKNILYLQNADTGNKGTVNYQNATIQPNDILRINVESLVPEAAIPYNKNGNGGMQPQSIQILQLDGYLVSVNNTINFVNI